MTGETKAELLIRNRCECAAKVAELERRIDARLRELRALLDWPAEAEFVARAKLDQKLTDLLTERMVYERLPDADARAVAEGRIEPFAGRGGALLAEAGEGAQGRPCRLKMAADNAPYRQPSGGGNDHQSAMSRSVAASPCAAWDAA